MLFLTRIKILLKRKTTLFWVILFPLLLASAEYFAFGKFITSTPIETIPIGIIEGQTPTLLIEIFEDTKISEDKKLYEIIEYQAIEDANDALENNIINHYVYKDNEEIKIITNSNSTEVAITSSIITKANIIETTINENPQEVNPEEIVNNLIKETSYITNESSSKNATFYTFYFYALMAMSCLYGALFGVSILHDIRADQSSLGIRISSSVVSKPKLIFSYFSACALLQMLSSLILWIYFTYILHISLGNQPFLILLTLILGGLAGITIGMLIGAFVKGEAKAQGIVMTITLALSCFAGLMSVEVKHLVDQYLNFIHWINPASLIVNSLYALYYYDNYTNYIIYTFVLLGISVLAVIGVIIKTRGEKYASL